MRAGGSEWSWRVPTLVQAVCPVIQLVSIWFVPESPRWLVSKGMESKASAVLAKYHAHGSDERDPLVTFEMAQIRHAIRLEEETNKSTSYLSLFSTPGNRKRMRIILAIAVFSQWRYAHLTFQNCRIFIAHHTLAGTVSCHTTLILF